MEEKIPKKNLPEFRIGKEQVEELKTVSAVTKVLADNPELAEEIAGIFRKIAKEKDRELAEKITCILAAKLPDVPEKKLKAAFHHWYLLAPPEPKFHLYRYPSESK
jgi:hypothetical protein